MTDKVHSWWIYERWGVIRYLARIAIIYRPEHYTRTVVGPWVQLEAQRPAAPVCGAGTIAELYRILP